MFGKNLRYEGTFHFLQHRLGESIKPSKVLDTDSVPT